MCYTFTVKVKSPYFLLIEVFYIFYNVYLVCLFLLMCAIFLLHVYFYLVCFVSVA